MKRRTFIFGMSALPLLSACGLGGAKSIYTTVTEGDIQPGATIPVPREKTILTISGKIKARNYGQQIDLDMPTIERMGLVRYTVDDPEQRRDVDYTGVLLQKLLDVAQYEKNTTTLHAIALNDYKIDIPLDILRWPVMIATQREGQRMLETEKGPLEIVFPNKDFQMDPILYNPMWVWQLRSLEVT